MRLIHGGAVLSTFRVPLGSGGPSGTTLSALLRKIRRDPIAPVEGIKEVERLMDGVYSRTCGKDHRVFGDVRVKPREYDRLWRVQGFSPTYGEITPTGVAYLFGVMLPPRPQEHFVDLGSGMGRLCLQAWLQFGHKLASITGVELSKVRHCKAVAAAKEMVTEEALEGGWTESADVILAAGDMFRLPLHDKTFIYCANLTFSAEILSRLARKILKESPIGARVVSMRPLIPNGNDEPQEPRGIPRPAPSPKRSWEISYPDCDDVMMPPPPLPPDPQFDDSDVLMEVPEDSRIAVHAFPRCRRRRRELLNRRPAVKRYRRDHGDEGDEGEGRMLKLVDHLDLPMTWSSHTPLYVYEVAVVQS